MSLKLIRSRALVFALLFLSLPLAAFSQQSDESSAYRALLCMEILKELRYFDKLSNGSFDPSIEGIKAQVASMRGSSSTVHRIEDLVRDPFEFTTDLPKIPDLISGLDALRNFHQKLSILSENPVIVSANTRGRPASRTDAVSFQTVKLQDTPEGYQVEMKRYLPTENLTVSSSIGAPISMVSPIISGATDFLISRAKDEVIYAFMVQLRDGIIADRRMQTLFPRTVALFGDFETLGARSLTSSLKSAVTSDFDEIGTRIIQTDAFVTRAQYRPYLFVFGWLLRNYSELRSGRDPVYILADLEPLLSGVDADPTLIKGLRLVREVAQEIYSNDVTKWSRINGVTRLHQALQDAEFRGFFFRSLIEELKQPNGPLDGASTPDLKAFVAKHSTDIMALINHVEELSQFAAKQSPLSKIDTTTATPRLELYLRTADKLFQIVEMSLRLGGGNEQFISQARSVADNAIRLERAIARHDYGQVTAIALNLFQMFYKRPLYILSQDAYARLEKRLDRLNSIGIINDAKTASIKTIFASVLSKVVDPTNQDALLDAPLKALSLSSRELQAVMDEFIEEAADAPVSKTMIRLMTLSANLAAASNPEEAEQAFEAAVDPVGSFRAKRRDKGYFTVNAYVGIRVGSESARESEYPTKAFYGVSAPIGVEIGQGFNGWSLGLMANVFDFGNLISYRMAQDQVASNPKLGIQQILSPGLYIVGGITDALPLSVGVGVQYVPGLRQSPKGNVNVIQTSLFFALDLALLRF